MKKFTILSWVVMLLCFSFTVVSCGDNDTESDEPYNDMGWNPAIMGTWRCIIDQPIDDSEMTLDSIDLQFNSETEMQAIFEYSSSDQGGGINIEMGQPYSYKMQGERIQFKNLKTNEISEVTYDITGDRLYISLKSGATFPSLGNLAGPTSAIYTKVKDN